MEVVIPVREKLQRHPELLPAWNPKTDFAQSLYHHALQRAILFWLEEKYFSTWQTEVFPMTLGERSAYFTQSMPVPSRVYTSSEIATKMSGNTFADIQGVFSHNPKYGLALPEGTKLEISPPHSDTARGEIATVRLENNFCTITIETRSGMSTVGAGSYRMVLGLTEEQAQQRLKANQYILIISAKFNPLLAGNPEMPQYKKWASDIADGLEAQFSDAIIWSKTKDSLVLHGLPEVQ